MLWLALYLPQLPLESATDGMDDSVPRLLYLNQAGKQLVCQVNAVATRAGIEPGMPLPAARALCQQVSAAERDPRRERKALHGLALWALQFTSKISLQPPHGLILEIGASLQLFGGIEKIRRQVLSGLRRQGYSVTSGIAPVASAAWLLAGVGKEQTVTDSADLESALRPLSLTLLPLDPAAANALQRVGLRSIGDCLRLPRAGLSQRLGPPVVASLVCALGRIPEPRQYLETPDHFEVQMLLPEPVSQVQPLLFILQRLLRQLEGFLRARDAGVQRMRLGLIAPFAPIEWLPLTLLAPARDPRHLLQLWQEKLERAPLSQPVEGLELQVHQLLPLQPVVDDIFGLRQKVSGAFVQTLERLKNRLGEQAVRQPLCNADHRPELATRLAPFPAPALQTTAPHTAERPLWLLPRPRPLTQADDGAPCLHGRLTLVTGPERIESGWWDQRDRRRDYYVARNQRQQQLWVYRDSGKPARWFLHGFFS